MTPFLSLSGAAVFVLTLRLYTFLSQFQKQPFIEHFPHWYLLKTSKVFACTILQKWMQEWKNSIVYSLFRNLIHRIDMNIYLMWWLIGSEVLLIISFQLKIGFCPCWLWISLIVFLFGSILWRDPSMRLFSWIAIFSTLRRHSIFSVQQVSTLVLVFNLLRLWLGLHF